MENPSVFHGSRASFLKLESGFIAYIKACGEYIDAMLAHSSEEDRLKTLEAVGDILDPAEGEWYSSDAYIKAIVLMHHSFKGLNLVRNIAASVHESEDSLQGAEQCPHVREYLDLVKRCPGPRGESFLCNYYSRKWSVGVTDSHVRTSFHSGETDTAFKGCMESGDRLGHTLVDSLKAKFNVESAKIYTCLFYRTLLCFLTDREAELLQEFGFVHPEQLAFLEETKKLFNEEKVSMGVQAFQEEFEGVIASLTMQATLCVLFYCMEMYTSFETALANDKYIEAHPSDGESFRHAVYRIIQFPGVEEFLPPDFVQRELGHFIQLTKGM